MANKSSTRETERQRKRDRERLFFFWKENNNQRIHISDLFVEQKWAKWESHRCLSLPMSHLQAKMEPKSLSNAMMYTKEITCREWKLLIYWKQPKTYVCFGATKIERKGIPVYLSFSQYSYIALRQIMPTTYASLREKCNKQTPDRLLAFFQWKCFKS